MTTLVTTEIRLLNPVAQSCEPIHSCAHCFCQLFAIRMEVIPCSSMKRFNDRAGEELITLKIGAHAGPCLAVTLNERLDYFGRTVNVAARVQGLASEDEVYLSDEMYRLPDAADLLAGMERVARTVHVKGIEREIVVHALRTRR